MQLQKSLTGDTLKLFNALFLGIKEKSKEGLILQHNSIYWGAAHHMARSGIHLAILFALIMFFFLYIPIRYIYKYWFIMIALAGYTAISNPTISFIRALIMIIAHILCKLLNHKASSLHIITLATTATLLCNPLQLFFLDFQLSFGITYIIVWLFYIKKKQTIVFTKSNFVRFNK